MALWRARRGVLDDDIHRRLWEPSAQKYRPHIYLGPSPFPAGSDESEVFYEGGTAVAAQAGLLSPGQIAVSLAHMYADMRAAHADSIGITASPRIPRRLSMLSFRRVRNDPLLLPERRGLGLVRCPDGPGPDQQRDVQPGVSSDPAHAGPSGQSRELLRVVDTRRSPEGSASFRGAAGELGLAALELSTWAKSH